MNAPRRSLRGLLGGGRDGSADGSLSADYESWLAHWFGAELERIDAECADREPVDCMPLFADLPDGAWAMLLSRSYSSWPAIRAALPRMPEAALQVRWNGDHGTKLLMQSHAFYMHATGRVRSHGEPSHGGLRILDFGCGWGRLTRFFARDAAVGELFGCDPSIEILDECRRCGVPARLARSEYVPDRVPFDRSFDLAIAFSIFTHLSEAAHQACLTALHEAIVPGGLLIATVRPPAYLEMSPHIAPALDELSDTPLRELDEARYLFVPHPADGDHPQHQAGEMTYGETVISARYVRERWDDRFELLDADVPLADPGQVVLTLRRRG